MLNTHLIPYTKPNAGEEQIYSGKNVRLTVLTSSLIRVECGKVFCDSATQLVWFRNFGKVPFRTEKTDNGILITTNEAQFFYNFRKKKIQYVVLSGNKIPVKAHGNLKGTARTLDLAFGPVRLKSGILNKCGITEIKDDTLLIKDNGLLCRRPKGTRDSYVFAYGHNYKKAINDFLKITGEIPLIPRYALGNWWSRWKVYTQEEYISLMQRFQSEGIPLSVATIDMDWHYVDIKKHFPEFKDKDKLIWRLLWRAGWTGYTWNKELFPDYKQFLTWLKSHGLKTVLNLHPSSGVRYFEEQYPSMARAMGIDPDTKQTIPFDLSNPKFTNAYFEVLHRPYEKDGIDFWWIDWQQGKAPKHKWLDALWALNHYHTLDAQNKKHRPLILSRYAGAGGHRYPLGFSGDTAMNWRVLRFLPYFTANAANIGYTWWSHDIGGHCLGYKDDELYLRWLQFGVFSPINRLHSTHSAIMGKEIWNYRPDVRNYAKDMLILRHKLIPYLYTMNYRTHREGLPLCMPLYYEHPETKEAYKMRNQYYFGSELLVCPITSETSRKLVMASVKAYLPKGRWTDIFTGRIYEGGKTLYLCRELNEIPVLAKEGAIIPMTSSDETTGTAIPQELDIWVYRGRNSFRLYEDNGEDMTYADGNYTITEFSIEENKDIKIKIKSAEGNINLLPEKRTFNIILKDIISAKKITVTVNGKIITPEIQTSPVTVNLTDISPKDAVEIDIADFVPLINPPLKEEVINLFSRLNGRNLFRTMQYGRIKKHLDNKIKFRKNIKRLYVPKIMKRALYELIDTADNIL